MSNPTVSFRISDYYLARGLRAIRQIEPNWQLTTPANLIKTIFIDYIAKSEHFNNIPLNISDELLQEIAFSRSNLNKQESYHEKLHHLPRLGKSLQESREILQKASQKQTRELEEERLFNEMRRISLEKQAQLDNQQKVATSLTDSQLTEIDAQISLANQIGKRILQEAPQEIETDSTIETVSDFSPSKEWKE